MRFALGLFAAALLAAACKKPEDQAARQRIFSPEQPVGADARAKEPLDGRRLADDPKLAERSLRMSRAEAATRLGPHKLTGKTELRWKMGPSETQPDGGPGGVWLVEETSLTQSRNGDFRARLENNKNQGFEAVWKGGEVFVKSRYSPFRKRRTDRSDPPRLREQTSASLQTFDQLARGLKLRHAGDTSVEGRRAARYEVAGAGARPEKQERTDLPEVQFPEPAGSPKGSAPGADPDTARRLSLWENEQPVDVTGTVVVDAETAVPLSYDLNGTFRVPQPKGPPADLSLRASLRTSSLGKELPVEAPDYDAEPSVPHAVKDPLRFLGKKPPAEEAPAEDEEEEAPEDPTPLPAAPKNKPR